MLRGTHAKGVCARAVFDVLDVAAGREPALAGTARQGDLREARLVLRDGAVRELRSRNVNADWQPDVR